MENLFRDVALCGAVVVCASLQRYAVAYGYAGWSRSESWRSCWQTAVVVSLACGLLLLARYG